MLQEISAAVYCRLSKEDGNEESQSIQSQKEILVNYVQKNNYKLYDIYIDDGYSGTNFDRPDFKRLLFDIENNKINIVITKDLSRLGRNYIQTGYYIEHYFPSKKVRYIALNDNYDTQDENSNDFAPFKNIINEWYAKDISKKIKFTLDNQAKTGKPRKTVFPLFGYTYNDQNERIIDPITAPIIKFIYEKYLETLSPTKVACILKENKIKRPCYYNAIKYGYNKEKVLTQNEEYFYNWSSDYIKDILSNYEYTGAYITSKSKSISFKNKKRITNNNYVFESRYEAIIDKNTFQKVQNILNSCNYLKVSTEKNIFKGIIKCCDCNKNLRFESRNPSKKNKKEVLRYYCNNSSCSYTNTIKLIMLKHILVKELMTLKNIILKYQNEFVKITLEYSIKSKTSKINNNAIEKYIKRINEIDNYILVLFEQNTKGNINNLTYNTLTLNYSNEKNLLNKEIEALKMTKQNNSTNTLFEKLILEKLKNINEENIINSLTLRSIVKSIKIKTIKQKNQYNKCNYKLIFRYFRLDNLIKEFLNNEF